jgi:hypothetical protein
MEAGAITARTLMTVLLATWPRRLLVGGLLLVPVIVAALGGFGTTEPRSFEASAGEDIDLGPLIMRPLAFFVSDETQRSGLDFVDGAEAWLGVVVEVENTTETHIPLTFPGPASDALTPQLPADVLLSSLTVASDAIRVADGTVGTVALPGVRTQVALLWPISDPAAVPDDELDAVMTESLWTFGPMSNEEKWMSLGDTWHVALPRTELPPAMFEPEDEF